MEPKRYGLVTKKLNEIKIVKINDLLYTYNYKYIHNQFFIN